MPVVLPAEATRRWRGCYIVREIDGDEAVIYAYLGDVTDVDFVHHYCALVGGLLTTLPGGSVAYTIQVKRDVARVVMGEIGSSCMRCGRILRPYAEVRHLSVGTQLQPTVPEEAPEAESCSARPSR